MLLKLGGNDSRFDAGDVRKGRDCRRFYEFKTVSEAEAKNNTRPHQARVG